MPDLPDDELQEVTRLVPYNLYLESNASNSAGHPSGGRRSRIPPARPNQTHQRFKGTYSCHLCHVRLSRLPAGIGRLHTRRQTVLCPALYRKGQTDESTPIQSRSQSDHERCRYRMRQYPRRRQGGYCWRCASHGRHLLWAIVKTCHTSHCLIRRGREMQTREREASEVQDPGTTLVR